MKNKHVCACDRQTCDLQRQGSGNDGRTGGKKGGRRVDKGDILRRGKEDIVGAVARNEEERAERGEKRI